MRMIESIRTYPLLKGVRGESARDVKALQDALLRLAQLVSASHQIPEIDLNPVMVLPEGKGYRAVDSRIVLAPPAGPAPSATPGPIRPGRGPSTRSRSPPGPRRTPAHHSPP